MTSSSSPASPPDVPPPPAPFQVDQLVFFLAASDGLLLPRAGHIESLIDCGADGVHIVVRPCQASSPTPRPVIRRAADALYRTQGEADRGVMQAGVDKARTALHRALTDLHIATEAMIKTVGPPDDTDLSGELSPREWQKLHNKLAPQHAVLVEALRRTRDEVEYAHTLHAAKYMADKHVSRALYAVGQDAEKASAGYVKRFEYLQAPRALREALSEVTEYLRDTLPDDPDERYATEQILAIGEAALNDQERPYDE